MKSSLTCLVVHVCMLIVLDHSHAANVLIGPGFDIATSSGNQFISVGGMNVFGGIYPQMAIGEGNTFDAESTGLLVGWDNHQDVNAYASLVAGMSNSTNAPFSFISGESNSIGQHIFGWNPGNAILGSYNEIDNHTNSTVIGNSNALSAGGAPGYSGSGSLVAGILNQVNSNGAWVLGVTNNVSGEAATAIGWSLINHYHTAVIVGTFNQEFPAALALWSEAGPAFIVGNGGVATPRSNAIETLKNGETTLINKAWDPEEPLVEPSTPDMSEGRALVVEGHTVLKGKVTIEEPQGDIPMFTGE